MGLPPNKRLKLTGPALRGSERLCTSLPIPQHRALAPAGARVVDDSPCPPGHNTPLPLERSPPVSFKRLLGRCGTIGVTYVERSGP